MDNGLRIIHPDAKIGANVQIEPFAYIGKDVEIGDGTWVGPNAVIMEGTRIGKNCRIFPGAIIGAVPQDLKYEGESSQLIIGDHVTIREYCTLNRGTKASHQTIIHDHCLLMAYVHVAHDCTIGHHTILANNVNLAGHIEVGNHVVLGGLAAVHQFVRIGDHAMVGGGSLVRKDVPPFVKAAREPLSYVGINSVGLRRRGFTKEQINTIQDIFRLLFVKGYNTSQAYAIIEDTIPPCPEKKVVLDFIRSSKRGMMKGLRNVSSVKVHDEHPTR